MEKFSLVDRFRLELGWEKATYTVDGVCNIKGAKFSGPALSDAVKLNDADHILLDFYSQYIHLVKGVYVAKLSWNGVRYDPDGTIDLHNVTISHDSELNNVPKLKDNDRLIIDTIGHDVENHPYNTVYKTYVVNTDTQLYKFN